MRIARWYWATLFFCLLGTTTGLAAQTPKAQVMFVGVAHLVARHDVHNSVFTDSPLSAPRQAQIEDIVEHLARFRPSKVLIEAPFGDPKYPGQYRQYLAGQFTLGADETYQYGFKLAARAGNASIYPIDTWGPTIYDDERIDAYLKAHFTTVVDPVFAAELAREHDLELHGTYIDELRYLNTEAAIRANASWYSIFDGMGRGANDAGSAYVAQWYTRNTYIFSNILSVVRPGDRVVVLMGQGHAYLQREFIRLDPNLIDVDPLQYLK